MLDISGNLLLFGLFLIINLTVSGLTITEPFYAMRSILVTYDSQTGRTDPLCLVLNFIICLILISRIVKKTEEQFDMSSYILTRTTRAKAVVLQMVRVSGNLAVPVALKLVADILLGYPEGSRNVNQLFWLTVALLITVYLWMTVVYFMGLLGFSMRAAYFITIAAVALSQYAAPFVPAFSILAVASPAYMGYPLGWLCIKVAVGMAIGAVNLWLSGRYEPIGPFSSIGKRSA